MHAPNAPRPAIKKSRKAFWLKQLHMWHWMSSAVSLIGLLLFAITGFTLNHAADIEGTPVVTEKSAQLPPALRTRLSAASPADAKAPLPKPVADWVEETFPVKASGVAEWSTDEVYLAAPRPGGDAWIAIDLATGEVSSEVTSRGWISYLNDLHKGRNSGGEWSLFIDIFAFACLVFAFTGLFLLWLHSAKRKSTWPLVGAGLAIPAAIAVIFIH
jgi:hypothetical protein